MESSRKRARALWERATGSTGLADEEGKKESKTVKELRGCVALLENEKKALQLEIKASRQATRILALELRDTKAERDKEKTEKLLLESKLAQIASLTTAHIGNFGIAPNQPVIVVGQAANSDVSDNSDNSDISDFEISDNSDSDDDDVQD